MTQRLTKGDIEKARMDPAAIFATPQDVVKNQQLSSELKEEILRRWAYDARQLAVAEEEGMVDGEPSILLAVFDALNELTRNRVL